MTVYAVIGKPTFNGDISTDAIPYQQWADLNLWEGSEKPKGHVRI
ncbi:MAG: hypothetical protein JWP34_5069 [Massilia sp.]|nr:hypothetical protein [Massilia sp.]